MYYTKKLISAFLSALCICPSVFALRTSISMPENLGRHAEKMQQEVDDSPYNLNKMCERIIRESHTMPIDRIIDETSYVCLSTFEKLKSVLHGKDMSNDYYVATFSNYSVIIEKLNYIIFGIILSTHDSILHFFTPSHTTKLHLVNAIFAVSSTLKKYERIFRVDLFANPLKNTKVAQLHNLMSDTWEGIWSISQLNSFNT